MSYLTVLEALHTQLATVPGIKRVETGEPATVQVTPMIYSMLQSFTRTTSGTMTTVDYRTRHRLLLALNSRPRAEEELIGYTNAIPAAICAPPRRGALPSGNMEIVMGDAGFVTIGNVEYRCLDFFSQAQEKARLGGDI